MTKNRTKSQTTNQSTKTLGNRNVGISGGKKWILAPTFKFPEKSLQSGINETVRCSRVRSKIQEPGHAAGSNSVDEPQPRSVYVWSRGLGSETSLDKHLSIKHWRANLRMTPATISNMAIYQHETENVKSLFENLGRALTSKCLKNDKDPHDCDCALEYDPWI